MGDNGYDLDYESSNKNGPGKKLMNFNDYDQNL